MKSRLILQLAACCVAAWLTAARSEPVVLRASAPASAEAAASGASNPGSAAPDSSVELAKKLANPIGAMISVPFQNNFDFGGGPHNDGYQYKLNFQPIVPITLNQDWNLISRTVLPVVYQNDIVGTSSQTGLADTLQSFFLSPKEPTEQGWIWGLGPALLLPTATDDLLGAEKWGAGPTAVVLRQQKGWTYGALVNHVWSFAGASGRADVNATYLQPFVSYTTPKATTYTLNTESTYDWTSHQWTAPLNLMVQQMIKIGEQPVALTVGGRYYVDRPEGGPVGACASQSSCSSRSDGTADHR